MKVQPKSIIDCATITSLERPGPKDFRDPKTGRNMVEEYIERKFGRSKSDIPILEEMLPETYGVLCIAENSLVKTQNGSVPIQDVEVGSLVQTEDGSYQEVIDNIYKGQRKTIKVRLDNSEELVLTSDHQVLTQFGWVEASNLTPNHLVKHYWASDAPPSSYGDDKDWVVGNLLADGNMCSNDSYIIATGSRDRALKIKTIADKAFDLNCSIYHHTRCWYVSLTKFDKKTTSRLSNKKKSNPVIEYCKKLGVHGLSCKNKKFPKNITMAMIEGFIEGDGNLDNQRVRLSNKTLAQELFYGLQKWRIKSSYYDDNGVYTVSFNASVFRFKTKKRKYKNSKSAYSPIPNWKLPRNDNRRGYFFPNKIKKKAIYSATNFVRYK